MAMEYLGRRINSVSGEAGAAAEEKDGRLWEAVGQPGACEIAAAIWQPASGAASKNGEIKLNNMVRRQAANGVRVSGSLSEEARGTCGTLASKLRNQTAGGGIAVDG